MLVVVPPVNVVKMHPAGSDGSQEPNTKKLYNPNNKYARLTTVKIVNIQDNASKCLFTKRAVPGLLFIIPPTTVAFIFSLNCTSHGLNVSLLKTHRNASFAKGLYLALKIARNANTKKAMIHATK